MRGFVGWMVVAALATPAQAGPGELADVVHGDTPPPLTILDPATATPCAQKPGVCIIAGSRSTIAVASSPVAAAAGTADKQSKSAIVVPRFSRAASVAAASESAGGQAGAATSSSESAPWSLEITGTLKRPAWNGNALFLFFDLEDPESLENRQFTALYQAPVKAGPRVAARVSLSPEDGFRPGHTYRVRIVQLISGKEIVLAESDVSLL